MKVRINGSQESAFEGEVGDVHAYRNRHGDFLNVGVRFKDWPTTVYFSKKEVEPVTVAE